MILKRKETTSRACLGALRNCVITEGRKFVKMYTVLHMTSILGILLSTTGDICELSLQMLSSSEMLTLTVSMEITQ